jgi:hypothetical protein
MDRVAFLMEDSGERIGCMLNPESLIIRRQAGVRLRRSAGGLVAGADPADDQILYSGGGNTELTMNLLFDVTLAGSSISTGDVRDLTAPLWRLAESSQKAGSYNSPPICRFVWGKSWNIPGIVWSIAERLEYFTKDGMPRRSFLRLLFRRVLEDQHPRSLGSSSQYKVSGQTQGFQEYGKETESYEVISGERPDQIGYSFYDDPAMGRAVMLYNNIDDPLRIPPGTILDLPPAFELDNFI